MKTTGRVNTGRIAFAHRGAPRNKSEHNTLSAFQRALALGASGLESDVGLTADNVPVLVHTGVSLRRGHDISRLPRSRLPENVPSLTDLYACCGHDFDLSLDMAQPRAADAVMRLAEAEGATNRLWLTYWHLDTLEGWRRSWPNVRLVFPTVALRMDSFRGLTSRLSNVGVDAVNVFHRLCRAGMVDIAHAQGLQLFAWGVRNRRQLERIVTHGVDGVYCDDVAAMVAVLGPRPGAFSADI